MIKTHEYLYLGGSRFRLFYLRQQRDKVQMNAPHDLMQYLIKNMNSIMDCPKDFKEEQLISSVHFDAEGNH